MSTPEAEPMTDPIAALVERLNEWLSAWSVEPGEDTVLIRDARDLLSTLTAPGGLETTAEERARFKLCGRIDDHRIVPVLSDIARLSAQLAAARHDLLKADGLSIHHSDRADEAEARLSVLEAALREFLPGPEVFEDLLWGDLPDDAPATITVPLGVIRRARAALRREPPASGGTK